MNEPSRPVVLDKVKDFAADFLHDMRERLANSTAKIGYDESSRFALELVEKKIDQLQSQVASGKAQPKEQTFLMVKFSELKVEMEKELREHWRDRDSWKPPDS